MTSTRENEVSEQEIVLALSREQAGIVIDALIEHRASSGNRKAVNDASSSNLRADECAALIERIGTLSASPTPPAAGGEMGEAVAPVRNDHDRRRVIAALQSTNDRLVNILIPKYGDQLDGFFDAMRDAINWMKRAKPRTVRPPAATPVAAGGVVVPSGLLDALLDDYDSAVFGVTQTRRKTFDADENEAAEMRAGEARAALRDAMLAAAPQQSAQGGWLPIESAPRDGTTLWCYLPEYDEQTPLRYVVGAEWSGWLYVESFLNDQLSEELSPSHWQPLPAPPKTAGGW